MNKVFAAFVPFGVVTSTLAEPALPAGVTHVMDVAEFTVKLVHALPPTVTADALLKLLPVMVMFMPPAVEPDVGDTDVTEGAGVGRT